VFARCSHLGLHVAGCATKQVISWYVGVGTRLSVTCLRESVENDGPDMEGPRQRGETVIAGETESRQEGLGWACIVWQYMGPLAVGIDMRRSSSLGAERKDSGELRMGDGRGSCLESSRMDAFFDKTSRHRRKVDPSNTPCTVYYNNNRSLYTLYPPA